MSCFEPPYQFCNGLGPKVLLDELPMDAVVPVPSSTILGEAPPLAVKFTAPPVQKVAAGGLGLMVTAGLITGINCTLFEIV